MAATLARMVRVGSCLLALFALPACGLVSVHPTGNVGPLSLEPTGAATGQVTVTIVGSRFDPGEVFIRVGTRVSWINQDQAEHTVTSLEGERFQSGTMLPQRSYSYRFSNTGRFGYRCERHPGMAGVINVELSPT